MGRFSPNSPSGLSPNPPTTEDVVTFLNQTYPKSGPDLAKLLFWCFVAGFSERFVPQIIGGAQSGQDGEKGILTSAVFTG